MKRTGQLTVFAVVAGSLATAALFCATDLPLGVPGEWTWPRVATEMAIVDRLLDLLPVVLTGLIYALVVYLGSRAAESGKPLAMAISLSALCAAGFAWLWVVQDSPPDGYRLSKAPFVLYYPASSGYFFDARYQMPGTQEFLASYEARVAQGDVLHFGTHPPGLFLAHRGLNELFGQMPALTRFAIATQPASVAEALHEIEQNALLGPNLLSETDRASLWLSALVTQAIAVGTVIPLYLLVRLDFDRRAAWLAASFWPLVPALAVFLPKSDALYPFTASAFLCAWMYALRRKSLLLAGLASAILWLGMCFSLAHLPAAVLAVALTGWEMWGGRRSPQERITGARLFGLIATGAAVFITLTLIVWITCNLNLPAVWSWNFRNHAAFYSQYTRTWGKWLLVNPLELGFGLGMPALVLAIAAGMRAIRNRTIDARGLIGIPICVFGVWSLLWLSGKNMGEAARLWLVLDPWFLWVAAAAFQPESAAAAGETAHPRSDGGIRLFWFVFFAQMLAAVVTVQCVHGFHYGG